MTNRSDQGSAKPRGAERGKRVDLIRDPIRGLHQGPQPCRAARTGRIHGCTRPVRVTARNLLHSGGHPHMVQRPNHCTLRRFKGRPQHQVTSPKRTCWGMQQFVCDE